MDKLEAIKALKGIASTLSQPAAGSKRDSTTPTGQVLKSVALAEPIAKSINDDKRLMTAVVLRPDVPDLHGDIYDASEVEKACHNFNTVCRKTNTQHQKPSEAQVVESFVSPADFTLGEGQVLKGDWVMTMKVLDNDEWTAVKAGEFTGFSIGCIAEVEELS